MAVQELDGRGTQAEGLDLAFMRSGVDEVAEREGLVDDEHDGTKDVLNGVLGGEGQADDGAGEEAENRLGGLRVDDRDGLEATDKDDGDLDDRGDHRNENVVQFIVGFVGDLPSPGDGNLHEVEDGGRVGQGSEEDGADGGEMQPLAVREVGGVLLDDEQEGVGG